MLWHHLCIYHLDVRVKVGNRAYHFLHSLPQLRISAMRAIRTYAADSAFYRREDWRLAASVESDEVITFEIVREQVTLQSIGRGSCLLVDHCYLGGSKHNGAGYLIIILKRVKATENPHFSLFYLSPTKISHFSDITKLSAFFHITLPTTAQGLRTAESLFNESHVIRTCTTISSEITIF